MSSWEKSPKTSRETIKTAQRMRRTVFSFRTENYLATYGYIIKDDRPVPLSGNIGEKSHKTCPLHRLGEHALVLP